MDIQKVIEEEQANLRAKYKREKEEKEGKEREAYETHPDTIMQNEMRELLPVIVPIIYKFATSVNAFCYSFYPPEDVEPRRILAIYQLYTKKGLIFKKRDKLIGRVLIGVKADTEDPVADETRYSKSCRLVVGRYYWRTELNTLPEKDKLEEWLVRELARYYAELHVDTPPRYPHVERIE
jgi:hypothetical protein